MPEPAGGSAPPLLHILAGPNGAGKTSLYDGFVSRITDAEFVNADQLARQALGRHALTREEAALGQGLADRRRAALLAKRASFVTESTFSHPSKLELVRQAQALGYRVVVYHVNLVSDDLAVARVEARRRQGGHPVAEHNIRGRYERNQPLIREAVLLADRAFVFDNSALGAPPRRLVTFVRGRALGAAERLPDWARALYGADLNPPGATRA